MPLPATVTLTNTLPAVVLTGNKVPLKFEASENFIETEGTKAYIYLTWAAVAVANEYFDLLLAGQTVRFTCKAAPDNSGVQFHDNSLGDLIDAWVLLLAQDLAKNYLIARYYDIIVDGNEIEIIAKETGSDYSQEFTAGAGIDCTANETNKTGTDTAYEAFYGIAVLFYCNNEFVKELILNVDDAGLAEVDIADLLKPYITQDFEWPESDENFYFARAGAIASWYFKYGERWGDGEYTAMQVSATYYAINGGVSWMQQAKYNADTSSFWAKLLTNKYFLSWAPLTRYIGPEEPLKLYFINHSAATTLKMRVKRSFANGSSIESSIDTITGAADKALYEMVFSPAMVGYEGLLDETLVKIEVWLDNQNDVEVSEIRTFILDYSYYEHTRYFIFKNSLGAFEVLRTTGLMQRGEEYTREIARVAIDSDYTSKEREDVSVSNLEQQKFTVALGWLSQYANADEYRNWLKDFTMSREVYQAIGDTLIPIRLTGSSFDKGKDRDNIAAFAFEFVNAFTDEYFTKELTPNLIDESFNTDFEMAQ